MTNSNQKHSGPLVSVLISTYNRPRYVCEALESILCQTYSNLEIILVRDGGTMVRDVISRFDDPRLIFIDRDENHGLAYSFNEALSRAKGNYICYLGDDDIFYPHHVEVLVNALEGQDEYEVAYSDLYKTHCRILEDGRRVVLSKNVEVTRDFNRMLMLQFNHALHVSLMHRRDLIEKTGKYNEELNVMIDWDMTRRITFYSDFLHVPEVTGEYYAAVENSDRISIKGRKSVHNYLWNVLTIRSTRPGKPWTKVKDLSLILIAECLDDQVKQELLDIWSHSFYPYQIYLPLPQEDLDRLETMVPNILGVPVSTKSSPEERFDAALRCCEGDYVAILPSDFCLKGNEPAWIERSLKPLMSCDDPDQAFEAVGSTPRCWSAVFKREQIERARQQYGSLPVQESVAATGIKLREPRYEEFPFQFDDLVKAVEEVEEKGDWLYASQIFEYMCENYRNELWMKTRWANALYHAGRYDEALSIAEELNLKRPTVSTLLIEARIHRKRDDVSLAIEQFEKAEDILQGSELAWSH